MLRAMYTSASSLLRMQKRQEVIAGNLANATTTGFRADAVQAEGFASVLQGQVNGLEPGPAANVFGADWIGLIGTGVQPDRFVIDTRPGPLRQSDNPLDLALGGPGFFAVQTADGIGYTRDGSFSRSANGQLVTGQGNPVLGADGPIVLGPSAFQVARDGTVVQDRQVVGRLQVVDFAPRFELATFGGTTRLAAGQYTIAADGSVLQDGAAIAQLASFQVPGPNGPIALAPGQLTVGVDGALGLNGEAAGRLAAPPGWTSIRLAGPRGRCCVPEGGEAPTRLRLRWSSSSPLEEATSI
ncbi:MAG: flagellar hook-basal body protein [Dehalococcoidia bacterium]